MKKIAFTLIALMLLISMTACSMVVDGINTKSMGDRGENLEGFLG